MEKNIREKIMEMAEEDYRKFSSVLIPNKDGILGVRLPNLRKLAKEIAKGDWRNYLVNTEAEFFEEIMLQGLVIGSIRVDIEEMLHYVAAFIPKIDNWAVCDSFCSSLKFTKKNRELVWDFMQPYLKSNKEYDIRFGVVMILNYFVEPDYIDRDLKVLNNIKHQGYYVKMAVAWALSICYIKFPEETMRLLKNNSLDDYTYNKALQKIIESNRIDMEKKTMLRSMRRK